MDELTCAVALSITSLPAASGVRGALALQSARDAFMRVRAGSVLKVQEHLRDLHQQDVYEAAGKIIRKCEVAKAIIVSYWNPRYPALLREIPHPPIVLYVRGHISECERIAVVGTRGADAHALSIARRIAGELAGCGFAIVSGMAAGIDREAHCGALERAAPTLGVLANGIDQVYPAANRDIGARILSSDNSALISEHPPGVGALRWSFSRRNRIVSGLARATVVVQAGEGSGALITARHAIEQNREVFACPGTAFDPGYAGCHALIKNGANLAASTDDILRELAGLLPGLRSFAPGPSGAEKAAERGTRMEPVFPDGSPEAALVAALRTGAMETDTLIRSLGRPAGEVQEALMEMEIGGHLERSGTTVRLRF